LTDEDDDDHTDRHEQAGGTGCALMSSIDMVAATPPDSDDHRRFRTVPIAKGR
jgi:hypothetical protein